MTDRRTHLANARVAAAELRDVVEAPAYADGTARRVIRPIADLCASPGGARDCQLLYGQRMRVLEVHEGHAFGAAPDGYVGYVAADALAGDADEPAIVPTHRVAVPATHLYRTPDVKPREAMWLSFGSELRVVSASGDFFETADGFFVPKPHLRPLHASFADAVTVAQLFFGVPYLWGGNSTTGIDCSGLVQVACQAAGLACPRDSDQQEDVLGETLPPGQPPQRGDLYFWAGHVGFVVDAETLIHANAGSMSVAYEPLAAAISRIAAQGEGPVTRRARL